MLREHKALPGFASYVGGKPPRDLHFLSRALLGCFCDKWIFFPQILAWYKTDLPFDLSLPAPVPPSLSDGVLPSWQYRRPLEIK